MKNSSFRLFIRQDTDEVEYLVSLDGQTKVECKVEEGLDKGYLFITSINRVGSDKEFPASLLLNIILELNKDKIGFEGNSVAGSIKFWKRLGSVFEKAKWFRLTKNSLKNYLSNKEFRYEVIVKDFRKSNRINQIINLNGGSVE